MSIEYFVLLSYGTAISFLITLIGGIGVVTLLRRMRLNRIEIAGASHPEALRKKLYMVHSPLDDMQTWHSPQPLVAPVAANKPTIINQPVIFPAHYQQTLLYGDDVAHHESKTPHNQSSQAS